MQVQQDIFQADLEPMLQQQGLQVRPISPPSW